MLTLSESAADNDGDVCVGHVEAFVPSPPEGTGLAGDERPGVNVPDGLKEGARVGRRDR